MGQRIPAKKEPPIKTQMSVSLPAALHLELERIARGKKVSLAWDMREAAEKNDRRSMAFIRQDEMSHG